MATSPGSAALALPALVLLCTIACGETAMMLHEEDSWETFSLGRRVGRHLLQGGINIEMDDVLTGKVPEPLDWHIYETEIRSTYQLRQAICESQGNVYTQDTNGADVDYCFPVGMPKKKIVVYLREDLYLRGERLPPVDHYLKIEGRCEDQPRLMCSIHAVSAMCSACPLPNEDTAANTLELCDACKFGGADGRETTPFNIKTGGKLWLKNIEVAGCKTQGSGGCIWIESGNRMVWEDANQVADLTYLQANSCRFKRGFADGEGGAMLIQTGALAWFEDCSFVLNFAQAKSQNTEGQTADKSHDIMIQNFAAAYLYHCTPFDLKITSTQLLPGALQYALPYQSGQYFIIYPPPAGDSDNEGSSDSNDNQNNDDTTLIPGKGGGGNVKGGDAAGNANGSGVPLWLLIVIVFSSLFSGALLIGCCWWCCVGNQRDEDDGESGMLYGSSTRPKSMFDRVRSTRGMASRATSRFQSQFKSTFAASRFSTRFQSAFNSYQDGSERGLDTAPMPSRFKIPGTDAVYSVKDIMKGHMTGRTKNTRTSANNSTAVAWADDS